MRIFVAFLIASFVTITIAAPTQAHAQDRVFDLKANEVVQVLSALKMCGRSQQKNCEEYRLDMLAIYLIKSFQDVTVIFVPRDAKQEALATSFVGNEDENGFLSLVKYSEISPTAKISLWGEEETPQGMADAFRALFGISMVPRSVFEASEGE